MNNMAKYMSFILITAITFLSGCQTTLSVYSQPEGAYMTEVSTGRVFGMAPIHVVYNKDGLEKNKDASGCYLVKGFDARWISGATTSIKPIQLCRDSPLLLTEMHPILTWKKISNSHYRLRC
jgi:hypothetical protein